MDRQVLLVDDDALLRRILRVNLVKRGLVVREAGSRASAVDALTASPPDILILDLNLPDGNGGDVLRELRRRGIAAYTVAMSAWPFRPGFLAEFQPQAFLVKPFRIEAFLALVQRATGSAAVAPDNAHEPPTRMSTALSTGLGELRIACHMLARASPQVMRSVALSLPLPRPEGLAPSALRLADAIAGEYNLSVQLEVRDEILRVHLIRNHDELDPSGRGSR